MKQPEDCINIEDIRQAIDALDRETIALIGRRAHYVEKAAEFKTGEQSVRAPERQRAMLAERRRWAEESGLDPDAIEEVYRTLISHFVDREMQRWRKSQ
ncbi:isochorismate lyase [soil metagenome]